MKRFTVFTVILTVIIVVVLSEIVVNDYLPRFKKASTSDEMALTLPSSLDLSSGQANVLGSDVDYSRIPDSNYPDMAYDEVSLNDSSNVIPPSEDNAVLLEDDSASSPSTSPSFSNDAADFENENFSPPVAGVFIRDDMVKSAGFTGARLEEENSNGYFYKTIKVSDLPDVEVTKYAVKTDNSLFAKVYVFQVGGLSSVSEIYEVLKVRASEDLGVEINETNEFGDESFFMNDPKRSDVAFLTVRVGAVLYGFSYPKEYHAQIKNLITLIGYEY